LPPISIEEMEVLNPQDAKRILEAALLCAHQPMTLRDMRQLFDDTVSADTVRAMLADLSAQWEGKGVALCELATGWRFQTRPDVQAHLDRLNPEKPPKYSRATLETLAIIAYKQPVTRGDIEDIRGVTVSTNIVKQLEDRGWIEVIGHRDAPGRPGLYATTRHFLDDLGLASLNQLPTLEGLPVSQGLLPGMGSDVAPGQGEAEPAVAAEAVGANEQGSLIGADTAEAVAAAPDLSHKVTPDALRDALPADLHADLLAPASNLGAEAGLSAESPAAAALDALDATHATASPSPSIPGASDETPAESEPNSFPPAP
jgi:segregation and condensation protein B